MPKELETSGSEALRVVSRLLEVGKADTVYRDLYLQRARALLAPLLSYPEYLRLEQEKASIDDLLRKSRSAVDRRDWVKVKELADQVRTLRQMVEKKRSLLELAGEIYDVVEVPLDPFSPGFQTLFAVSEQKLMRALVGGDVRYGGIYDLCSISRADEREGVITRFAVVRRERLVVG